VPVNEFLELMVMVLNPTVPGEIVSDGRERLMLKAGITPEALTRKLCETMGAAAKVMLSPGCEAMIVQVPAATKVAVHVEAADATVQTEVVVDAKLTANPEVAVAASVIGVPATWVPGLLKVMVCVGSGARMLIIS